MPRVAVKSTVSAVDLSAEQQHAVELCCDLTNTFVGVTGGAGTGKTLVLGHVYAELRRRGISAVLCAPTGRAAKRVQELTGIPAKTVHRLLEFPMPDEYETIDPEFINEPRRNKQTRLVEKVVIVDESSMLGPTLYRQLIDSLPKDGVIRFFGDNNQLPPVEEGIPPFINILERFPSIELLWNYRSDDAIVSNALRILQGRIPERNTQFDIKYAEAPLQYMLAMVGAEFAKESCQIIMPTRKGKYGTMRVNPSLQLKFNGKGPMLLVDRYDEDEAKLVLRRKDKFLWVKNDYKLEMFNGEIGTVDSLDTEDGSFKLKMQDRIVEVPPRMKTFSPYHQHVIDYDPRKQIELGYAITTHKSQGSEFKTVVYCIDRHQAFLLNRRNFYTAITRAKKNVIIVTDRKAMGLSMKKHEVSL